MELEKAQTLYTKLIRKHADDLGLRDWTFGWNRQLARAGVCDYAEQSIKISRPITLLHPQEAVQDTILHELAHAWAGWEANHGPLWQERAVALGATPEAYIAEDLPTPPMIIGLCPNGHENKRLIRPAHVLSCGTCSPVWNAKTLFKWCDQAGNPVKMTANYLKELKSL